MNDYMALFEPASKWDQNDTGFVVTFPDFEWGVTQGETAAEAMEMAADALALVIEELIRQGKPLPRPKKYRGSKYRTIRLSTLHNAKIALWNAFTVSGIRKAELARKVGIDRTNIDRLFDLRHQSRLDHIDKALNVLGKQISLEVRDAA